MFGDTPPARNKASSLCLVPNTYIEFQILFMEFQKPPSLNGIRCSTLWIQFITFGALLEKCEWGYNTLLSHVCAV